MKTSCKAVGREDGSVTPDSYALQNGPPWMAQGRENVPVSSVDTWRLGTLVC